MKERIKHLLLFIVLIAIDQLTKYWVKTDLADNGPLILIKDVFSLQYQTNTGAAFSVFTGNATLLSIFTFVVLAFIVFFYFKVPSGKRHHALRVIIVFIMAGAVGNLIDRVALGHVVDFVYFELINFPLFNFADSCLTVASILLLILALFYYKDEDFVFLEQMFRKKKTVVTKESMDSESSSHEAGTAADKDTVSSEESKDSE